MDKSAITVQGSKSTWCLSGAILAAIRVWLFVIWGKLLCNINKSPLLSITFSSTKSEQTVSIMYFGRISEFLLITSERIAIPGERYSLNEILNRLRERGDRWAYELDDSHVICVVAGKPAKSFELIEANAEINIYSKKSIFEI